MTKQISLILAQVLLALGLIAQNAPFDVVLEPVSIPELGGIQSYSFGQHDGKWLIVGGRLDGLHRRQPFAAFDLAGHNNQIIVVDPVSRQKWTRPLSSLPVSVREQLSSTNMQFYQEGDVLYCIGGYGYSETEGDHTTFSNLTAIQVSLVIDAVIANTDFTEYFRQITDPLFQVTGGSLEKINGVYHLSGGQKFIGRYNPMGPNNGPGFIQEYTNSIRKFSINDNGSTILINHLPSFTDAENLHRRDYNAISQILPNGEEGITLFSGVFQPDVDLPFLNSVTVNSQDYTVNNTFQQYYNHYHCAVMPLYSEADNEMHTVFFGGIAQYYDSVGILVQDNNVPFVKTIARVTRDAEGNMTEYKLPVELPEFLGAGSEFIPNRDLSYYPNGVLQLDQITADTTLAGYIYGGISSSAANVFWINDGTQSSASSQIYKVLLLNNTPLSAHQLNEQGVGSLKMQVYPNPSDGDFVVKFNLQKQSDVNITLYSMSGKKIDEKKLSNLKPGENVYKKKIKNLYRGGVFLISLETSYEKAVQKIIIEP